MTRITARGGLTGFRQCPFARRHRASGWWAWLGVRWVGFIGCTVWLLALPMATFAQSDTVPAVQVTEGEVARDYDAELARVQILMRANVLDLAQTVLEQDAPPATAPTAWLAWEQQLWALYHRRQNWTRLLRRVQQIPVEASATLHQQAKLQEVQAYIGLNQGQRARTTIREQFLQPTLTAEQQSRLRKLLVQSYLADNLLPDAGIAMRSYQRDYRSQQLDWLLLRARVYIQLNDPHRAIDILAPLDLPQARLLRLFARIQTQSIPPDQAAEKANGLLEVHVPTGALNLRDGLAVLSYAGLAQQPPNSAIDPLERYLIQPTILSGAYPQYGAEDLVRAYQQVAQAAGNNAGLLVGDYDAWHRYAKQLPPKQATVKKSIYGYLVTTAPALRQRFNSEFVTALMQTNRIDLVPLLYGEDKPLGVLTLRPAVGLRLSNSAIENGNATLAAYVNQTLRETPQGVDHQQWRLHVARISIIAGQYQQGADELRQWLAGVTQLQPQQVDQVLQPVFDLQTVNQHELALDLLHQIQALTNSKKHQRELAYWLAESYQGSEQHTQAADYFLYSALQKDNGRDRWGESARYRAAESLHAAKLFSDAKRLFADLLAAATDETMKTRLQQKLQQLSLLETSVHPAELR